MTVPSMTCCKQPTPVNMHSWHKRSLVHFFFRERTETRSETWMKAWPRILCILFKHAGLQTSKPGRRDCNHVGEEACPCSESEGPPKVLWSPGPSGVFRKSRRTPSAVTLLCAPCMEVVPQPMQCTRRARILSTYRLRLIESVLEIRLISLLVQPFHCHQPLLNSDLP